MIEGLEAALAALARAGTTVTYGQLARELGLAGPATIARLTAALEATMEADAAAAAPLRAALCRSRAGNGLPAEGFFDKARRLGRHDGTDPAAFVARERAALWRN